MITNPELIENTFKCDERVAKYLMFKCGLPLLGFKNYEIFYFAKTDALKECLKNMPLGLKLLSIFKKGGSR